MRKLEKKRCEKVGRNIRVLWGKRGTVRQEKGVSVVTEETLEIENSVCVSHSCHMPKTIAIIWKP